MTGLSCAFHVSDAVPQQATTVTWKKKPGLIHICQPVNTNRRGNSQFKQAFRNQIDIFKIDNTYCRDIKNC